MAITVETFLRTSSFYFRITVRYNDTKGYVDLNNAEDIIVYILNQESGEVIAVKQLTQDSSAGYESIVFVDASNGVMDVAMNPEDMVDSGGDLVDEGMYEYIVEVIEADSNFTGGEANFKAFGEAFILA